MCNCVRSVRKWYNNDRQEKVNSAKDLFYSSKKIYRSSSKFVSTIAKSTGNTAESALKSLKFIKSDQKLLALAKYSKLFCILQAPFKAYRAVKNSVGLYKQWSVEKRRTHHALKLVTDLAKLTEISAYFAKGLEYAGKISKEATKWTTPALIVGSVLSAAKVVSTAVSLYRSHKTQGKIEKYVKEENYDGALDYVCSLDKFSVDNAFKIKDADKFKSCLKRIQEGNTPSKAIEILCSRINHTKISRVLSILADVINIIGVAILFFCPLNPAGYAILAIGGIVSLSKFIFDQVALFRFKKSLDWDFVKTKDSSDRLKESVLQN